MTIAVQTAIVEMLSNVAVLLEDIMRDGARSALLNGKWDPLQDLLNGAEAVEAVATNLPYMAGK